jgi:predicted CXXCH cytochrome family protein
VKKVVILAALVALGSATGVFAQQIANTPHDFSAGPAVRVTGTGINGQTCVFCHTPHGGLTSAPLWNRTMPLSTGYTLYSSDSMDSTPGQPTKAASAACLSCHDGSLGMDTLINVNGSAFTGTFNAQLTAKATYTNSRFSGGAAFIGRVLNDDHPVAITYSLAGPGLVGATLVGDKPVVGTLPLYGTGVADGTVECGSCHNPHNNFYTNFLRISNASSAMCLTCHIK